MVDRYRDSFFPEEMSYGARYKTSRMQLIALTVLLKMINIKSFICISQQ